MPRTSLSILALSIVLVPGSAGAATAELSSFAATSAMRALAVPSPYRIPQVALEGTIRYRLALDNGERLSLPETGEQGIHYDEDAVVVTVCADCGNEAAPTADQLEQYRSANDWVQSRDRRIIDFARRARRPTSEATMLALTDAVKKHMNGTIAFNTYASATQAFESRSGDCTEFAVLLAAAARARGIPARIVVGLAYAPRFLGNRHVFTPHLWVQVWNGKRWISHDAGLDGFDATHIALAIGDGSPQAFAGLMRTIAHLQITAAAQVVVDEPAARRAAAGVFRSHHPALGAPFSRREEGKPIRDWTP